MVVVAGHGGWAVVVANRGCSGGQRRLEVTRTGLPQP